MADRVSLPDLAPRVFFGEGIFLTDGDDSSLEV
jgi:hypothetical protein